MVAEFAGKPGFEQGPGVGKASFGKGGLEIRLREGAEDVAVALGAESEAEHEGARQGHKGADALLAGKPGLEFALPAPCQRGACASRRKGRAQRPAAGLGRHVGGAHLRPVRAVAQDAAPGAGAGDLLVEGVVAGAGIDNLRIVQKSVNLAGTGQIRLHVRQDVHLDAGSPCLAGERAGLGSERTLLGKHQPAGTGGDEGRQLAAADGAQTEEDAGGVLQREEEGVEFSVRQGKAPGVGRRLGRAGLEGRCGARRPIV